MKWLAILLFIFTGCSSSTVPPVAQHPYPALSRLISTYGEVIHPEISAHLARLTQQLQFRNRPFRVLVLNADKPNAYAGDDSLVLITLPLYKLAKNDDELAFVLAHEYGHLALHHVDHGNLQNQMRHEMEIAADAFAAQRLSESGFNLQKGLNILLDERFAGCEHSDNLYQSPRQRYLALIR